MDEKNVFQKYFYKQLYTLRLLKKITFMYNQNLKSDFFPNLNVNSEKKI